MMDTDNSNCIARKKAQSKRPPGLLAYITVDQTSIVVDADFAIQPFETSRRFKHYPVQSVERQHPHQSEFVFVLFPKMTQNQRNIHCHLEMAFRKCSLLVLSKHIYKFVTNSIGMPNFVSTLHREILHKHKRQSINRSGVVATKITDNIQQ